MKKILFVLIALLFASAFAVADADGAILATAITVSESDTAVGNALVEVEDETIVVQRPITRLHLTGNGLAISEDDAFDFMHAKITVGSVKVNRAIAVTIAEETAVAEEFVVTRIGVLMLDDSRYHLKDVAVAEDEISAEIYNPVTESNAVSEAIGEITVKLFEKPGRDVWAGNIVLNGKAYNVYFLGMARNFRLAEVTEKIGGYCGENPEDSRCMNIIAECASNRKNCSEVVENYCSENTSDLKCLQLKKQYCLKNASDERCREYLKGLCEDNSNLVHCRIRTVNNNQVISINMEQVSSATAEAGEDQNSLVRKMERATILKNVRTPVNSVIIETVSGRGR